MEGKGKGRPLTVAIDGPAGAGKSTVARSVAQKLGYLYLDTGAMYRAITLKALQQNVPLDDEGALTRLACETVLEWQAPQAGIPGGPKLYMDGVDVSEAIRHPRVTKAVSLVARVPGVRQRLIQLQRRFAEQGGVVVDGRDIGTVVLPHAECKFYLTASLEERARRRQRELAQQGMPAEMEEVKSALAWRDTIDSGREISPLRPAEDAVIIDTTGRSVEEVVEQIYSLCKEKEAL
ncbi:MAG: (d)CMP kinase [Bacillota bacterium]|nr:(d)CMP kinase [Bacillota bacterium]